MSGSDAVEEAVQHDAPGTAGDRPARRRVSWRRVLLPALVVLVGLFLVAPVAGALGGKLGEVSENDQAAFLPDSAESTRSLTLEQRFAGVQDIPALIVYERPRGAHARRPGRRAGGGRAGVGGRRRRRARVAAAAERGRPRRPARRAAAGRQHRLRAAARHRRAAHRGGAGAGPADVRHGARRAVRRLRRGLRGHRRAAALHDRRRDPRDPAAHLPQPGVPAGARLGRPRAGHRAGPRLPRRRRRAGHGERAEPGDPLGARAGRQHRLRAAAHQPVQGGAAPRGLLDGRHADRRPGRLPADHRLRRHRRAGAALPAAQRPQQQQEPRPGRRARHRQRGAVDDGVPAGAAARARALLVLALRAAPRRRGHLRPGHLAPGGRPRRPPAASGLGRDRARCSPSPPASAARSTPAASRPRSSSRPRSTPSSARRCSPATSRPAPGSR